MRGNASLTAFICVVNELVVLLETSARRRLNSTKTCSGTTSSIDLATSISSTTFNNGAERWSSTMRNHQLVSIRSFFFRVMGTYCPIIAVINVLNQGDPELVRALIEA